MADIEIVYGVHAVESLLTHCPELVLEVWADKQRDDMRLTQVLDVVEQHQIALQYMERNRLTKNVGSDRHQGIAARCRPAVALHDADLDALLDNLSEPPLLLILDGVQDPHNLGACLRTADAAGVHAVIAPKDRAVGLNSTVRKVASGATETMPFISVTNLARTLRNLKDRGIWLIGTAGEAEQSLYQADLSGPVAIVMGAEEKGLRRLTRETCDALVTLPMAGSVSSLNVSVATGVCLYEALRQRRS